MSFWEDVVYGLLMVDAACPEVSGKLHEVGKFDSSF